MYFKQVCCFVLLSFYFTLEFVLYRSFRSIILFNCDYLNSTTILLCLCFYSLYYNFVNLNFICNNNNLFVRLSFHFAYGIDEEIRDFEIYLSIISRMWYWCCFTLTPSDGFLYICIYMVFIYGIEGFFEVAIESWPEWDLNLQPRIPFRRSNWLSY